MERETLNFVLKDNNYIKGGTKEACIDGIAIMTVVTHLIFYVPENVT